MIRVLLVVLAALLATPALAQQFDPMTPDQRAAALPLERQLTECYMRETNKPYVTREDVRHLIDAAVPKCEDIAIKLKGVLGVARTEAFWNDFELMLYSVHMGKDDVIEGDDP